MAASYQLIGARESRDASAHNDDFLFCAAALALLPGFQRTARDSRDRAPGHLDHIPPLHRLRLLKSNRAALAIDQDISDRTPIGSLLAMRSRLQTKASRRITMDRGFIRSKRFCIGPKFRCIRSTPMDI